MGVPSLFKNVVEYDPSSYIWDQNAKYDHLYFDFNNLIHFCRGAMKPKTEEELITEVIKYTSYITTKVIKPRKLVYISFDGPVPYGKMVRQRARRHKKVQDSSYLRKLHQKFGVEQEESIDSNIITPGTSFMTKLSSRLRNFAQLGAFSRHAFKDRKFNVIISDASVPGEGEHKIFQFLKKSNERAKCVIYGMDADLIILSMQSMKPGIKLLRESETPDSEFKTLDVDIVKKSILHLNDLTGFDELRVIQDFVYFSSLGGNDFVPASPSLHIRDDSLGYMFKSYKQLLDDNDAKYLIDEKDTPNHEVLQQFLQILETNETVRIRKKFNKIGQRASYVTYFYNPKLPKEEQIKNLYEVYEHGLFLSSYHPFHKYYLDRLNAIDYQSDDWEKQYNEHFFGGLDLDKVCDDYLLAMKWTYDYYKNNEPPSWFFAFDYRVAPTLHSFMVCTDFERLTNHGYSKKYTLPDGIDEDKPLSPYEQMLLVLPIQNTSMLPGPLQFFLNGEDAPLADMYARKFDLDVLAGLKNIYSEPLLPSVDFRKVRIAVNNALFNEIEIARNIVRSSPFKRTFGGVDNTSR